MFVLDEFSARLVKQLLEAFVAGGSAGPRVPPGVETDELAALLTRLMVNDGLLRAYCAALAAGREERGLELRLLEAGGGEVPDREIAERGFGWLPPGRLADLATSPEALEALAEGLRDDPDLGSRLGAWFFEAGLRDQAERPGDAEQARRLNPKLQALRDRIRNGRSRSDGEVTP